MVISSAFENKLENWGYIKMLMLLDFSRRSPINIIDVGTNYTHESIKLFISDTDMLLIAVNPHPVELNKNKGNIDKLLKLKKEGLPVEFIINYYTPAIPKKELSAYLKIYLLLICLLLK